MPFDPKEIAQELAEDLNYILEKSWSWSIWRWKNERTGVISAIEESLESILPNILEKPEYQFLSQKIISESLQKSFSSNEALETIRDFLTAKAPSISFRGMQAEKAKKEFSKSYAKFIEDHINQAMNSAIVEAEKEITQTIVQSFREASQEEIEETIGLYNEILVPIYPKMRDYYNETDGVAEAISELVIKKLKPGFPKDSFEIEKFQESFNNKINEDETLAQVEEFLAQNAKSSLFSGIGKEAARKIFLGDSSMSDFINELIDEAIAEAKHIDIPLSEPSIEEALDFEDVREFTEDDEDQELKIPAAPVIDKTDFGLTALSKFDKKMLNSVNDNRQNIIHHFTLNNKTFTAEHFALLLGSRDISAKEKSKIKELANQTDNKGMTPMHYAAINGDIAWMAALGGDLIRADQTGRTPIDYILDSENPDLVEDLIKECLADDINKDLGETRSDLGKGTTLAHCIAKHPIGYRYTEILAKHKANLRAQNIHGDTPLMIAASAGKIENIYSILNAAAEIVSSETHSKEKARQEQLELLQMKNNNGREAIHLLVASRPEIKFSHLKKLADLQSLSGSALGTLDNDGNNIAHILGEAKSVTKLIEAKELKPLLTARNKLGQTPISVLLNHQRQVNDYNYKDDNPLKQRNLKFIDQVKELFSKHPEILSSTADNNGESLIHYIARNGYHELLPDVKNATMEKITNKKEQTPLHLAAMYGHDQTVAKLLEEYPDKINAQDKYGNTALHYAAINGNIETIRRLAFAGANPYLLSKAGTVKDEVTGKYKPMETVFDILDRYRGKAENPVEDQKITSAMAMLALNAGVSEQLKKYQKKRIDKALETIGKNLASQIYEVVKKLPRDQKDFCKEITEITENLLKDKRLVNDEENLAFSNELNKALEPIYKDMKKFEDAKNYTTKYKWNLVMRVIDCIANTFTIIGYGIWGLGRPENKILYAAKKVVTAKLDDLSKARFKPEKEKENDELIAVLGRLANAGVTHNEHDSGKKTPHSTGRIKPAVSSGRGKR